MNEIFLGAEEGEKRKREIGHGINLISAYALFYRSLIDLPIFALKYYSKNILKKKFFQNFLLSFNVRFFIELFYLLVNQQKIGVNSTEIN